MQWEVLESEYLFKRPWLTARREHVKLPTGAEIQDFYILEYPDFCNVIAITKEGQFVLERQYRHAQQITGYEIPAGCVEPGEDAMEGAKHLEESEDIRIELFSEEEVFDMLQRGEFHQAMMVAPLWKYFAEKHTQNNPL